MATVTLNVRDETMAHFRAAVQRELGTGKGTLGKAAEDALKRWTEEKAQNAIAERQMALMRCGLKMKRWKFNREELYDRKY